MISRCAALAVTLLLFAGAPALAQVDKAPTQAYAWVTYVVASLLGLVIVTLSLMPSKRTHQD